MADSNQDERLSFQQLSPVDEQLLSECASEALFYRSLPCSGLLGVAAYGLVKSGRLLPHPSLGAFPKVAAASLLGMIWGKLSYHRVCEAKLKAHPDSNLGELLRRRERGLSTRFVPNQGVSNRSPSDDLMQSSDYNPISVDHKEGLHAYNQMTSELATYSSSELDSPPKIYKSYDELRKENREDYVYKHNDRIMQNERQTGQFREPYARSKASEDPTSPFVDKDIQKVSQKISRRNQYGDIIDE